MLQPTDISAGSGKSTIATGDVEDRRHYETKRLRSSNTVLPIVMVNIWARRVTSEGASGQWWSNPKRASVL